jgi:5S rRNA maturation endonuclease (ribonuclease M5)
LKGYTARWGRLPQLQLPSFLFTGGVLKLSPSALSVYMVLLHTHKAHFKRRRHDETEAKVKIKQAILGVRTGYRRDATVSDAVQSLQAAGLLQINWNRSGSGKRGAVSAEYKLTMPETGEPIPLKNSSNIFGPLRIPYFTLPTCVLTSAAHWGLSRLTGPEVRLYVSFLWITDVERSHRFQQTKAQLCRTSALAPMTFDKALDSLRGHGLIHHTREDGKLTIQLLDPFTGEAVHIPDGNDESNPANYVTTDARGTSRRLTWNEGTDAEWAQMVRDALPIDSFLSMESTGEIRVRCPFPSHVDMNPSCFISPSMRIFQCFGCGKKGTLTGILKVMTGSTGEAMKRIAKAKGLTLEFHQPDSAAIAKYDYRDIGGNLRKQVLRFPNDEHDKKVFSVRMWTDSGWLPGSKGVGPMLYNAEWLKVAGTAIIVEGERDATSVNDLHLCGYGGLCIGVTSGSAGSWKPGLAKLLREKKVIVMPDNDARGEDYAEAIRASLDEQHIDYTTVSFAGTGANDVSEYLANGNTVEDLVRLINSPWVSLPDGIDPHPEHDTGLEGEISI